MKTVQVKLVFNAELWEIQYAKDSNPLTNTLKCTATFEETERYCRKKGFTIVSIDEND